MKETKEKAHQYFNDSVEKMDSNLNEALELIEKAIQLVPESTLYWSAKAQYQHGLGEYKNALESIEKAIKFNHKSSLALAWSRKGLIKRDMGEYKQAAEAYIESLKIEQDFNIYTLLCSVQLEFDPEAAIQSAKQALKLNPDWDEAKNLLKETEAKIKKEKGQGNKKYSRTGSE